MLLKQGFMFMVKSNHSDEPKKKEDSEPASTMHLQIKTDEVCNYCKLHYKEILAYGLLILGIFLFFFESLYGGVLVGMIAGIYFGDPIVAYLIKCKKSLRPEDIVRHLILGGVALTFFIAAPSVFLGAAVAIILKELFLNAK